MSWPIGNRALTIAIDAYPQSNDSGTLSIVTADSEIKVEIDQRIAAKLLDELLMFMGSPPFDE